MRAHGILVLKRTDMEVEEDLIIVRTSWSRVVDSLRDQTNGEYFARPTMGDPCGGRGLSPNHQGGKILAKVSSYAVVAHPRFQREVGELSEEDDFNEEEQEGEP